MDTEATTADALPKPRRLSRRKFLFRLGFYGSGVLAVGDALLEPGWLRVRRRRLGDRGKRLAHLTDLHYKGEQDYLEKVVTRINAEKPDAVLCTGDFIEKGEFLEEALEILAELEAPFFGVPGNHDFWGGADFEALATFCAATGGRWLENEQWLHDDWLHLSGVNGPDYADARLADDGPANAFRALLCHYPIVADTLDGRTFDLIAAGHSHGGQIRLPFIGALLLPNNVGNYDLGWFDLDCGPLHVSAGVGTYFVPLRFGCRPDVAIIEV